MFSGVDKVVEALLRGQESANCLKTVLEHPRTSLVSTEPLFDTVLDSFSLALSLFTKLTSSSPQLHRRNMAALIARKLPKKKSYTEDALEHYIDDSQNPVHNDDFCWRKYGQKKIKNSTYLRCYFRCAYAKDRNCNATKRVQQIQESPPVYRTTYVGKHICEVRAFSQPNDDITDGSKMIHFDKIDQTMSESVMPQLVSLDHQAITITDKSRDQIMNQEYDNNNEFLVDDDDQFLAYQFPPYSPGSFMFLDDISAFDYNP